MAAPIPPVNLLVEGPTDEVVARRLLCHVGLECSRVYGNQGKDHLLRRLHTYNQAARYSPWLAIADLDQSAECAPDFVGGHLPQPAVAMVFRVAVRAVEAWLLADAVHLGAFLGVSPTRIPTEPDGEADPKRTLVNLARQSRRKSIRRDMVPRAASGGRVGPGYAARVIEFVSSVDSGWDPRAATSRSESLERCIAALRLLRDNLKRSPIPSAVWPPESP